MKCLFWNSWFIFFTFIAPADQCSLPPSGLIAWWPGDGNANEVVANHNGVAHGGISFGAGKVGQAFTFDGGTSTSVDVPTDAAWNLAGDFTIELWMKINEFGSRGEPFIAHDKGPGPNPKWIFWTDKDGESSPTDVRALRFNVNDGSSARDLIIYPWNPALNQWYHVAVTRAGDTFALYIDGSKVTTRECPYTIQVFSNDLTIGHAEAFHLNGMIDEAAIYVRALSANEIQAIYNADSAGKCKPPVTLRQVRISGDSVIQAGASKTYRAVADFSDGTSLDVSSRAIWTVIGAKPEGTAFFGNLLQAGLTDSTFVIQVEAAFTDTTGRRTSLPTRITIEPRFTVSISQSSVFDDLGGTWRVGFTGTAAGSSGTPLNFTWDLNGDGVFETPGQDPIASYFSGRSYLIGVKATDGSGQTATTFQYLTLNKSLVSEGATRREPETLNAVDLLDGAFRDASGQAFSFDSAKTDAGLIIIVHGFCSSAFSEWIPQMAHVIEDRLVAEGKPLPNIVLYDWKEMANPGQFDGSGTSCPFSLTFINAVKIRAVKSYGLAHGLVLANWLKAQMQLGTVNPRKPIHIIGHSAGGFVAENCAGVLKNLISQITMLDTPVPERPLAETYLKSGGRIDTYVTAIGNYVADPQQYPTHYYYYEPGDVPYGLIEAHAWAHEWYATKTIDPNGMKLQNGFWYSPWLGNSFPSPGISKSAFAVLKNASPPDQFIQNFESFGNVSVSNEVYTVIEELNAGIFKTISLPVGAQSLKFNYRFTSAGDGDFLSVHWGSNEVLYLGPDLPISRDNPVEAAVAVADFAGQSNRLVFKLVSRGSTNAVVLLDQIRLSISDDPDGDGLSNDTEAILGTNPLAFDTDGDGLSDGDEVNVYHTNPLLYDTDGDGVSDGQEIAAGTDPSNPASIFKIDAVRFTDGSLTLEWTGNTNYFYRINRSLTPSRENFTTLTNGIPGLALHNAFTDAAATNSAYFYWVEIQR